MRLVIAAVLGGLVVFLWGFVSHMFLPLGQVGVRVLPQDRQDAALTVLRENLGERGFYMLPTLENMDDYGDEAKMKALEERMGANPWAVVVYEPEGANTDMGPQLAKEFATNVLSAFLAAFVVGFAAVGFGTRVMMFTAMGAFAWVATHVPYWNWYRFPTDFTLAQGAMQVIGWLLGGLAMAWWLGRARR